MGKLASSYPIVEPPGTNLAGVIVIAITTVANMCFLLAGTKKEAPPCY